MCFVVSVAAQQDSVIGGDTIVKGRPSSLDVM